MNMKQATWKKFTSNCRLWFAPAIAVTAMATLLVLACGSTRSNAPASHTGAAPALGADGGLPVSERLSGDVISLPMHAYLDEPSQQRVIEAVRGALQP